MPVTRQSQATTKEQNQRQSDNKMPSPPWSKNKSGSHTDDVSTLRAEVEALREQFRRYRHDTAEQIDALQVENAFENKFRELRSTIDSENSVLIRRFEDIENRLAKIEEHFHFDPEVTVVAQGVTATPNEDAQQVARELIRNGLNTVDIPVIRAKRLPSRNANKPGLLKIELPNLEAKKKILRRKTQLNKVQQYRKVYLRSSKTHAERLIELNTMTLLQQMPSANQFRMTGNGRLIPVDERRYGPGPRNWAEPPGQSRSGPSMPDPRIHAFPPPPNFTHPPGPPPFGYPPMMQPRQPPPPHWGSRTQGPLPPPPPRGPPIQGSRPSGPRPETQTQDSHL